MHSYVADVDGERAVWTTHLHDGMSAGDIIKVTSTAIYAVGAVLTTKLKSFYKGEEDDSTDLRLRVTEKTRAGCRCNQRGKHLYTMSVV